MMLERKLGNSGLKVSALSLSCMGYGKARELQDRPALIRQPVGLGIDSFDTAEAYGPLANAEMVGEVLNPVRDQRHGATPARIAVAWLLAQKPWIVSLFGARRLERLEENLGCSLAVPLITADLEEIDRVSSTMSIQGARYPEAMLRRSDREAAEAEAMRP
jgi:aryl-alcohol dehydrogenase-like predicted oxidoreductase